jgi:hypothetical protein
VGASAAVEAVEARAVKPIAQTVAIKNDRIRILVP